MLLIEMFYIFWKILKKIGPNFIKQTLFTIHWNPIYSSTEQCYCWSDHCDWGASACVEMALNIPLMRFHFSTCLFVLTSLLRKIWIILLKILKLFTATILFIFYLITLQLTEVEGGVGPLRAPQNFKLPSKFTNLMGWKNI